MAQLLAAQKEIRDLKRYHNSYTKNWVAIDRVAIKHACEVSKLELQLELHMAKERETAVKRERDEEHENVKAEKKLKQEKAKQDEEEIDRLKEEIARLKERNGQLQWLEAEFAEKELSPLTRRQLGM